MDKKEQPNKDLEKTQTYIIKNKKVKAAKKPKKDKKPKKPSKHPKLKKAIKITVLVTFLLILIGGGIAVRMGSSVT